MRTFTEIQEYMKSSRERIIREQLKEIEERTDLTQADIDAKKSMVENRQRELAYIEEVTTIEIGASTNELLEALRRVYEFNFGVQEYWQNFDKFINDCVLGKKYGHSPCQMYCLELGIGMNELSCLKGIDPKSVEAEKMLKSVVNVNLATNIPLNEEVEKAYQEYISTPQDDERAYYEAYIRWQELKRDSGRLLYSGVYHTLADDLEYQKAKEICSNRSL